MSYAFEEPLVLPRKVGKRSFPRAPPRAPDDLPEPSLVVPLVMVLIFILRVAFECAPWSPPTPPECRFIRGVFPACPPAMFFSSRYPAATIDSMEGSRRA